MEKYKNIDEFFDNQTPDKLKQINLLRKITLETEPSLTENLKWNAPNYVHNGEDRITFNLMNKQNTIKLIIHMGATKKENKTGTPVLEADGGIVNWNSDIRGTIQFDNLEDIRLKSEVLRQVLKDWLSIRV